MTCTFHMESLLGAGSYIVYLMNYMEQVESKDANYEFLLNYMGLFNTTPTAKETQAEQKFKLYVWNSLPCVRIHTFCRQPWWA